jgi:DNA-binding transcriptional MerR regulator
MRLMPDLKGARVTVARAAELAGMHPTHLRRLCRRGIFPKPKRTSKGRPYYDYELLTAIAHILKTGIGMNAEEIMFYRRRAKRPAAQEPQTMTPYLSDIAAVLRQLGVPERNLTALTLKRTLKQAFGSKWPDVSVAIPELNRRLLA